MPSRRRPVATVSASSGVILDQQHSHWTVQRGASAGYNALTSLSLHRDVTGRSRRTGLLPTQTPVPGRERRRRDESNQADRRSFAALTLLARRMRRQAQRLRRWRSTSASSTSLEQRFGELPRPPPRPAF